MIFKNILQLYALLICLITTVLMLIFIGQTTGNLFGILAPEYKNNASFTQFDSNEAYLFKYQKKNTIKQWEELKSLSSDEISNRRHQEKELFTATIKAQSLESLFSSLQWLMLSFIFFIIHWKLHRTKAA